MSELKDSGRKETQQHRTVHHPWGVAKLLEQKNDYTAAELKIYPDKRLQLPQGSDRTLHLFVIKGVAKVYATSGKKDLRPGNSLLYYDYPSASINQLRQLLSLRRRLKIEDHSIRMRIRNNLLALYFPELDRFYGACETESLAIVRWFLDPSMIAAMEFDEFFSLVTRTKRGIAQKQRLQKIHRLAAESVGCPMGPAAEFEAELLVVKLKEVRRQLKKIADLMQDYCMKFTEYSILLTIPGFGPYIAARVLASISNPWRFVSSNQVIKIAGYDLGAPRSGKRSDDAVPVISKRGKFIKRLIAENPGDSRRGLSKKLCEAWNWIQPNGALRDMVCRGFLLRL
ncbi:MAG: transposase, partial [bacterium]|nr:transposase [bacterium]